MLPVGWDSLFVSSVPTLDLSELVVLIEGVACRVARRQALEGSKTRGVLYAISIQEAHAFCRAYESCCLCMSRRQLQTRGTC